MIELCMIKLRGMACVLISQYRTGFLCLNDFFIRAFAILPRFVSVSEGHDGDAGVAFSEVSQAEGFDPLLSAQVCVDGIAKRPRSLAVDDPHALQVGYAGFIQVASRKARLMALPPCFVLFTGLP